MAQINPFRISVPDADLADLKERLARTRWPEAECVDDWSQGIPLSYTRELADYWANEYDWRAREAALNRFDQFTTEIDGLDIHFIHQRSSDDDAFPLLITHGWPGSIVEFHKVIEPLTASGFHVVCPSLPGYGFSGKPSGTGWGVEQDRRGVGDVDGSPGLRALRRAGRRLGRRGHHADRPQRRSLRGDSPEHATRLSPRGHGRPDRRRTAGPGALQLLPQGGTRAIRSNSRPDRRPSVTGWWIRPPGSWPGSWRSSGRGWTATAIPRTCSPATSCSTT